MLLASNSPKDPKQLVTYAQRAADTIAATPTSRLPESKLDGAKPSQKKWAALLRAPADALAASLNDVNREAAEAVTTQTTRNQKRDASEAYSPRAHNLLEGFLRFGAMDAEADRLKRAVSSASSAEETDAPPTPGDNNPT